MNRLRERLRPAQPNDAESASQGHPLHSVPTGQQFREAFAYAPVGMSITALDGHHLHVNQALCDLTGYTAEELTGRDFMSLTYPEDIEPGLRLMNRLIAGEIPHYGVEKRYIRKDGRLVWVRLSVSGIRDHSGRLNALFALMEDITERKAAEDALKHSEEYCGSIAETAARVTDLSEAEHVRHGLYTSEERLILAQEAAGVGAWDADLRANVNTCTDQYFRLYGREPAARGPSEQEWALWIHPDDRERVLRTVREAMQGSGQYDTEFRVEWPDGSTRWLMAKGKVFFDDDGRPVRLLGSHIDLTEFKRVEQALRQSEERFRTVFTEAAIGMTVSAADGKILHANKAMCAITGRTEEELRQTSVLAFTHPDDYQITVALERRLTSGAIPSYVIRKRYVRKDGTVVWARSNASAVRDGAGKVVNVVGLAEDISARVAAEEALRRSEERFRTAAEHATDVIVEVDLRSGEMELFGRCGAIMGEGAQDFARDWPSWIDPEDRDRVAAAVRQSVKDDRPLDLECRARRPDGSGLHVAVRGTRLAENPGKFLLLITDITARKTGEETASRLAAIVRSSENAIVSMTLEGVVQTWNGGAEKLYGYRAEEMIGRPILALYPRGSTKEALNLLTAARSGRFVNLEHATRLRKDGSAVIVSLRCSPLYDASGTLIGVCSISEDITSRTWAEEQLRESEERFRRVFQHSPVGMALLDHEGGFFRVNSALCDLLGYSESELANRPFLEVIDPADRQAIAAVAHKMLRNELPAYSIEMRLVRKDGAPMWVRQSCSAVRNAAGEFVHGIAIIENITQRREAEDQLAYQAQHDVLTELPNRRLLEDRVQQAIAYARRSGGSFAMFYIDLDSFKLVNDSLGHLTGDVLLKQVAERLRNAVRESDTLARTGGDEFVLVATNLHGPRSAEIIAEKIHEALAAPFQAGGHELFVTASIGISMYPKDGGDAQSLQRSADSAMYEAKRSGKNAICFFTRAMSVAAIERLTLESQLRRALENREMSLVYQPQYHARTQALAGFEALLRWKSPSGIVPPQKFIPVAEETGLIVDIGNWVLYEACRQILRWSEDGRPPVRLAVNVSEVQFARPDFVRTVQQCLQEHRIKPRLLEMELTETVVLRDFEAAAAKMGRLRDLGVSIAIDDFGTGYSSLSYLQRLPIDALKIDRSFIKGIGRRDRSVSLLRALVALCRSLKMRVVAEGVETPRQLEIIRELGCDEVQGFLLGCPSPLPDFLPGTEL